MNTCWKYVCGAIMSFDAILEVVSDRGVGQRGAGVVRRLMCLYCEEHQHQLVLLQLLLIQQTLLEIAIHQLYHQTNSTYKTLSPSPLS